MNEHLRYFRIGEILASLFGWNGFCELVLYIAMNNIVSVEQKAEVYKGGCVCSVGMRGRVGTGGGESSAQAHGPSTQSPSGPLRRAKTYSLNANSR